MSAESNHNKVCIVRAYGEIDLHNVDSFAEDLRERAEESPCGLIVDLSGATYIDSAGMQILFTTYKRLRETNGLMVLVVNNPTILELLSLLHLEKLPGMLMLNDLDSAAGMFSLNPQPEH